jgi:rhodanese-related sulfurtransferase
MGIMGWLLGASCESLSADVVKSMKKKGESFVLVDVRTHEEHSRRKIDGAKLIPLQEFERRAGEIPQDKDVVLYCQNGIRSLMACRYLKKLGYSRVKNLDGGISRW